MTEFPDPVADPSLPWIVAYDPTTPDPVPPAERLAGEPEHVQANQRPHFGEGLRAGSSYGCAVPGINLNTWTSPTSRGWGAACQVPLATIKLTDASVTVHSRLAELAGLIMRAAEARGYRYRKADTGGYNCRVIAGTASSSWHGWGHAIDGNWTTNPSHPCPVITDRPGWEIALWNRYGWGWGGDYDCSNPPDSMHVEFHGTPAQADAALALARAELGAAPPPPPAAPGCILPAKTRSPVTGNMEVPGFDCSSTKPKGPVMAGAGYQFVVGYVSPTPPKNLSAGDYNAYRAAGLGVGLVWESTAGRALTGGTAGGAADGAAAEAQANALGYPTDAVIFFAVDQDTAAASYAAIQAYANGFNSATRRPVGIYGEADVVDHFVTPGKQPVQYGWQTAAWSGGRLSGKAHLYQRIGHPAWPVPAGVAGTAFDEDVATLPVPLAGWTSTWPLPTGDWFGKITDTNPQSHGGAQAWEQPHITSIQTQLGVHGYPVTVDGFYGPATFDAVAAWQGAHYPGTQFWGAVFPGDWDALSLPAN